MKNTITSMCCLLLGAGNLIADTPPPATPVEAFKHISILIKAGKIEEAVSHMTKKASYEFISYSAEGAADVIATKQELPKKLSDGTPMTAKPADTGFSKIEYPKWFTDEQADLPPQKEVDQFLGKLVNIINQSKDRNKTLQAVLMLSDTLELNEFRGKLIPRPTDAKYPKETILVDIDHGGGDTETRAIKFKKVNDLWKYDGTDWDATDAEEKKFVEKKDIAISGKTIDGKPVSLSGLKGKVVLIDFWGTW